MELTDRRQVVVDELVERLEALRVSVKRGKSTISHINDQPVSLYVVEMGGKLSLTFGGLKQTFKEPFNLERVARELISCAERSEKVQARKLRACELQKQVEQLRAELNLPPWVHVSSQDHQFFITLTGLDDLEQVKRLLKKIVVV